MRKKGEKEKKSVLGSHRPFGNFHAFHTPPSGSSPLPSEGTLPSNLLRLPLQPRPRPLLAHVSVRVIVLEKRFRLLTDLVVVGVDPVELGGGEEVEEEEAAAEGHHGDVFEAEVGFVAESVGGGDFARHDDV